MDTIKTDNSELAEVKKILYMINSLINADFGYIDYVDEDTKIPFRLFVKLDLRISKIIL